MCMAIGDEAPAQPIEKARSDRLSEALGLLEIGVPFAGAMGCYEAIFGHCALKMPRG